MRLIASLLIPVLLAEVGVANPPVFKTHINKTVAVANTIQQNVTEGSRRRAYLNRLSEPQAIAVDNTAGRLYWTDTGVHKIYRANFDGLGQQPLVEWAPNPRGIAVVHDKIYWSDSGTHQINRANMDGSSREILFTGL